MKSLVTISLCLACSALVTAQDEGSGGEDDFVKELEKKQEELQELQRELQQQELNKTTLRPPSDESLSTSTMASGLIQTPPPLPVVRLAGLFDLGGRGKEEGGGGCNQLEMGNSMSSFGKGEGDLQLLSALRWAARKLEAVAKDVKIEIEILDSCGDAKFALARLLSAAARGNLLKDPFIAGQHKDCTSKLGGIIYASSFPTAMLPPLPKSALLMVPEESYTDPAGIRAASALIRRLRWRHVVLVSLGPGAKHAAETAKDILTHHDVCIVQEIVVDKFSSQGAYSGVQQQGEAMEEEDEEEEAWWETGWKRRRKTSANFLVIGRDSDQVLELILRGRKREEGELVGEEEEGEGRNWLIVTQVERRGAEDQQTNLIREYKGPDNIYLVEKNYLRAVEFTRNYRETHSNEEAEDPRLRAVIKAEVIIVTETIKQMSKCENKTEPVYGKVDSSKITEDMAAKVVGLTEQPVNYIMLFIDKSTSVEIAQFDDEHFRVSAEAFFDEMNDKNNKNSFQDQCESCRCVNERVSPRLDPYLPALRVDTMTTVLMTVAAVGALCSAVFAFYLTCKACGEVVEGSQVFTVLLLLVFIFMYVSLFLFALSPTPFVCFARVHSAAVGYTLLFAVFLARSVMLATADTDGLPGHISGVVQLCLFFALSSVQLALTVQEWLLRSDPFTVTILNGRIHETCCADIGEEFLVRLVYPMILLGLQVVICPFIAQSRRNYHEGKLFCLGTFACVLVWLAWTVAYFAIMPGDHPGWFSVAVCLGIIATPSSLLLLIFVPKCYLMSSPQPYGGKGLSSALTRRHRLGEDDLGGGGDASDAGRRQLDCSSSSLNRIGDREGGGVGTAASTTLTTTAGGDDKQLSIAEPRRRSNIGSILASYAVQKREGEDGALPADMDSGEYSRASRFLEGENDLYDSLKDNAMNNPRSNFASANSAFMDYPTFKLDRNTVVDTSMKWERYSYPQAGQATVGVGVPSPPKPAEAQGSQQQQQGNDAPPASGGPVPVPKMGTRL